MSKIDINNNPSVNITGSSNVTIGDMGINIESTDDNSVQTISTQKLASELAQPIQQMRLEHPGEQIGVTQEQAEQLLNAIVGKFTQSDLEQLLYLKLGKDLGAVSRDCSNYNGIVFDVIRTAQREDWIDDLIAELHNARPTETAFAT